MNNPIRNKPKHLFFNLLPLTYHLIFLSAVVSSHSASYTTHKTQHLTGTKVTPELVIATLNQTILKVSVASSSFSDLQNRFGPNLSSRERCALEDCLGLLDDTISDLQAALSNLRSSSFESHDVKMLLSNAITNQDTCLDGFSRCRNDNENNNDMSVALPKNLKESILNISNNLSNSLDMLQVMSRKNPSRESSDVDVKYPGWVSEFDQRLLQAPVQETSFNLSVAKDGTGNFTTISAAVSAAPNSSETRFIIYIKGGEYFENVEVPKKKTMIMFVGDGIGKTVIKANRNCVDGWPTFRTATVGVKGKGFIAKDITFVNFAGPAKKQAVALRSGSDLSAFYRCAFYGYQDTLYVHSAKQFYRECDIYGTIDFICGNAAVVFQNCSLYARRPIPHQKIAFTAQSRNGSAQPTGISIIHSRILAAPDLIPVKGNFTAYFGRPWRNYSRTAIIKSYIDDLINPSGWLEWNKSSALEPLYYGEYMNEGPGANMTERVKWSGFRRIENSTEATQFTVGQFINGDTWLNSTGIPFSLGF
ncbi:PREDICTED: probable pectinesterase/pectinesterase inhibitor 39 isoform X2 [Camelina sativa]|uniref:Probable pectinesterase/pectinesterase inhibitor 39 isoform X1 n=1 Tax=Camelina sativa TaxID=90675 RepID=A0ABM1QUI0_CAMSA|nr:PREDICTED: probable pectinesterase/pectinesterase inhibitor 39 isoform X1 [Camelina sativa]XP_019090419.1 PREDICTED: probable pectinesterase/pectinesterase inhibitor 39 isoform X2 [Camelina sativa]